MHQLRYLNLSSEVKGKIVKKALDVPRVILPTQWMAQNKRKKTDSLPPSTKYVRCEICQVPSGI